MKDIKPLIDEIVPSMITLRRRIHSHPEPGFHEFETARKVMQELKKSRI